MKVNDIFVLLEEVAPVALSDELCKKFNMYDNSGIILNCGNEVTGALFSLDLSERAVKEAVSRGFNLIVTHHPAIYGGISRIDTAEPLSAVIAECLKRGISVISMHLNYDCAPRGIDYHLMRGLGGDKAQILAQLSCGGYGRFYSVKPSLFSDYVEYVKKTFSTQRVFAYGSDRQIKSVASFCGAGCDNSAIAFAAVNKADVFVSADLKHHEICALLGRGINVIQLTHYASETYGFGKIYNEISAGLPVPSAYCNDAELM